VRGHHVQVETTFPVSFREPASLNTGALDAKNRAPARRGSATCVRRPRAILSRAQGRLRLKVGTPDRLPCVRLPRAMSLSWRVTGVRDIPGPRDRSKRFRGFCFFPLDSNCHSLYARITENIQELISRVLDFVRRDEVPPRSHVEASPGIAIQRTLPSRPRR